MSNNNNKQIAGAIVDMAMSKYPTWGDLSNFKLAPAKQPTNMQKVDLSSKEMAQVPLDNITKGVLCGTICGDSSININKGYKNARFQSRHSTKQAEWFSWKFFVILKDFVNKSAVIYTRPGGYQPQTSGVQSSYPEGKLKIASKAHPTLTKLHKVVCVNNKKSLQRSWLNHMNDYFLMTVWLDDGSLYNGRQGLISFNSFPVAEQQTFRKYLLTAWGIETYLQDTGKFLKNGHKNYRIHIKDQDNLEKLLRIVAPIIPVKEMLYKVCYAPKEESKLQRWRTELKGLVKPEFVDFIDKFYDNLL